LDAEVSRRAEQNRPQKTITMKHYYFNPKTQDLTIFDTESKDLMVLERILGIRVLTSSDLDSPGGDEPVKHWKNSNWEPKAGKAGYKGEIAAKAAKREKKAEKRGGKWKCKNCGELGHSAKTCTKPPTVAPAEGTT